MQNDFLRISWSLVENDERISLDIVDVFVMILSMCLSKRREESMRTPRSRIVSTLVSLWPLIRYSHGLKTSSVEASQRENLTFVRSTL